MTENQAGLSVPAAADSVSPEARAYLDTQLEPGERVLWAGPTSVSGRMRRLRPFLILCAFMVFLCGGVFLLMDTPSKVLLAVLAAVVWAAIGAFVYWRQSDHLRRTLYAITDQRVLILTVGNPKRTESYPPDKLEFVRPVVRGGGRGDIIFTVMRGKGRHSGTQFPHGFLDIAAVEQVAALMQETFDK
jgi:hypothetical protein